MISREEISRVVVGNKLGVFASSLHPSVDEVEFDEERREHNKRGREDKFHDELTLVSGELVIDLDIVINKSLVRELFHLLLLLKEIIELIDVFNSKLLVNSHVGGHEIFVLCGIFCDLRSIFLGDLPSLD
jgi:hypothetical protein